MATARFVVNTALRKLGVLASGREPRLSDQTDALDALRSMYGSWVASGAFGRLRDVVPTGTQYTSAGNERIFRESADVMTVVLPELVSEVSHADYGHEPVRYYGTTVTVSTVGNETIIDVKPSQPIGYALPPRDGSVVVISDRIGGETRTWIYDGTTKRWESPDMIVLDDEAPRSSADVQGLASMLALEIADQFDASVPDATVRQASRYQTQMVARFGMRRESVEGVYF